MSADMVDIVDKTHDRDGAIVDTPKKDDMGIEGDADFEPRNGLFTFQVQSEPEAMTVEPQDSLQQMDNLSSDGITLNGYYGTQQNVQGLLQLNLMEPPHDGYYVNQQSMQGLGQLNSIAPNHDGFFGSQQGMHGLGHLDFRPQSNFSYSLQATSTVILYALGPSKSSFASGHKLTNSTLQSLDNPSCIIRSQAQ
ncbi:hypothetical protein TEA_000132 [Camellia sinensis var. sinensis]|uniref:Uncharacterized protein n=1 Tax=Camellia sinensis var. sinensis TaxID=542762 RepID=A0A4V3WMQ0_CAMSN|nr:hypothetical protein TEA_000132 [Camellia sinensis var. sinensis]